MNVEPQTTRRPGAVHSDLSIDDDIRDPSIYTICGFVMGAGWRHSPWNVREGLRTDDCIFRFSPARSVLRRWWDMHLKIALGLSDG